MKPQESVWDYPRPPRLEKVAWRIRVEHQSVVVCDAPEAYRVLETSQPPAYYVDEVYIDLDMLCSSTQSSFCEWKGMASYADIDSGGQIAPGAAWTYHSPTPAFAPIANHWAFYAQLLDHCSVDDELVAPNPGNFYGGWVTSNIEGPFKGGPGSAHW